MPTTLKEKMAVQLREEIDELKRKLALLGQWMQGKLP